MSDKPVIGLVQGDPAGIGPELMVKLLSDESVRERARIAIIGAPSALRRGEETVGVEIPRTHVDTLSRDAIGDEILHLDLDIEGIEDVPIAQVSAAGGHSSLTGLKTAFGLSKDGVIDGICFMPFNKESMHMGGAVYAEQRSYLSVD